jgi:prephenate dehydrogenase
MFEQLGLIGCGLMGGSFALALKQAGLVKRVVGYSKSAGTTEKAHAMGIIDSEAASALQAAMGADVVLIAVPVSATESTLQTIQPAITPDMLVMDVGSTKRDVVDAARRALGPSIGNFVPAHPIAGKEVSGVENADADLYAERQLILTPTEQTLAPQLEKAHTLWTQLGCKVRTMSPEQHDAAFASVSHLPHLIAFALMNAIAGQAQGQDYLSLAGPGFRDFTRIAASEPTVWRDILLSNREELLAQSQIFQRNLQALEVLISGGDAQALESLIAQASVARANWGMNSKSTT